MHRYPGFRGGGYLRDYLLSRGPGPGCPAIPADWHPLCPQKPTFYINYIYMYIFYVIYNILNLNSSINGWMKGEWNQIYRAPQKTLPIWATLQIAIICTVAFCSVAQIGSVSWATLYKQTWGRMIWEALSQLEFRRYIHL